jgi:hypothetical protein
MRRSIRNGFLAVLLLVGGGCHGDLHLNRDTVCRLSSQPPEDLATAAAAEAAWKEQQERFKIRSK